jgi:small subunit ribosomal protein S15
MEKERKTKIIDSFKKHESDTGSSEVQVALITDRINGLVEHLKKNRKDQHSRRGLLMLVGQRKRLLNYLQKNDIKKFEVLTASLGLK